MSLSVIMPTTPPAINHGEGADIILNEFGNGGADGFLRPNGYTGRPLTASSSLIFIPDPPHQQLDGICYLPTRGNVKTPPH